MSFPFSAAELASLQATELAFMPDTLDVLRPANTVQADGSVAFAFAVVHSGVPCMKTARVLRQLVEHVGGAQLEGAVRWNVVVPLGTDITVDDRLLVTEVSTGSQMTLEVNGLLSDETWPTAAVVECLRLQ